MLDDVSSAPPCVALVFGDAGSVDHLRELVADRVRIVYETSATDFNAERLTASGATAALVNLDGCEWLDAIEAHLNDAGLAVVFNDPEISGKLDGWERARWLRHLTAKLSGHTDYDPPRPAAAAPSQAANDEFESGPEPALAPEPVAAAPAVVERPLSPSEIESLTADFVAVKDQPMSTASLDETPSDKTLLPDPVEAGSGEEEETMTAIPEAGMKSAPTVAAADASDAVLPGSSPRDADIDESALDVDTETLSAMIDARLAKAENRGSPDSTVWRIVEDSAAPVAESGQDAAAAAEGEAPAPPVSARPDDDSGLMKDMPALSEWQLVDPESSPAPAGSKPVTPDESVSLGDFAGLELVPLETTAPVRDHSEPMERWMHDFTDNDKTDAAVKKNPAPDGGRP